MNICALVSIFNYSFFKQTKNPTLHYHRRLWSFLIRNEVLNKWKALQLNQLIDDLEKHISLCFQCSRQSSFWNINFFWPVGKSPSPYYIRSPDHSSPGNGGITFLLWQRGSQNQLPLLRYFPLLGCDRGKLKDCRMSLEVILLQMNCPEI